MATVDEIIAARSARQAKEDELDAVIQKYAQYEELEECVNAGEAKAISYEKNTADGQPFRVICHALTGEKKSFVFANADLHQSTQTQGISAIKAWLESEITRLNTELSAL
ncbi:hypothetical protein [Algivirga pacifica]|uniref:Uncharacterized protein n=1 Tax=Algivirga pacifica TaxID=1162670 RepID=A0ABP9D7D8_9BACT